MKIFVLILLTVFLFGCNPTSDQEVISGKLTGVKGCDGMVDGILIRINDCMELKKYEGKKVEITGNISENKCDPDIPQCFSGKEMTNIKSIEVLD